MAQAQVEKNRLRGGGRNELRSFNMKAVSTQTENTEEFCVFIGSNKTFRVYFSKTYNEFVLSFNFGNSKKYILTSEMWIKFREYIHTIDKILTNQK